MMQSDLRQRLEDLKKSTSRVETYRGMLRSQLSSALTEEEKLRYRADLHQKCAEIIKAWLEDSLKSNVDTIADLATTGLRHIIPDQELTFRIKQESKYNRVSMRFVIEEPGSDEGDPMESFGGGAVLVISLIMRLAVMSKMKMGNLLLLDESMSALANKYVPGAASFIRQLSEQTGVNILMVTHNPEFMSQAHSSFEGQKTEHGLQLYAYKA
jgi:DNA repair exonuclease SbcCD ATPase subunit